VVGHDRNAGLWMTLPQELDLFDHGVDIISGMNNENQYVLRLEFAERQIVGT
jgi:hypothetical protein